AASTPKTATLATTAPRARPAGMRNMGATPGGRRRASNPRCEKARLGGKKKAARGGLFFGTVTDGSARAATLAAPRRVAAVFLRPGMRVARRVVDVRAALVALRRAVAGRAAGAGRLVAE